MIAEDLPPPGGCIPNPKRMTWPAHRPAGWSSSGSPGPDPMIVVDSCCYGAQINHDHGTSRAPGRRFMITEDLTTGGVAAQIRNRWPGQLYSAPA